MRKSWTPKLSPNPPALPLPTVRRHRTEQRGPLSIINGPLVVLSTRPMHILKKYPVNMLCIRLVRRLDKKESASQKLMWTSLLQHLHTTISLSARLLGDQRTNLAIALHMEFKDFPQKFFLTINTWQGESEGKQKNLSHWDLCTRDGLALF